MSQGAIVLGGNFSGGNCPGGNSPEQIIYIYISLSIIRTNDTQVYLFFEIMEEIELFKSNIFDNTLSKYIEVPRSFKTTLGKSFNLHFRPGNFLTGKLPPGKGQFPPGKGTIFNGKKYFWLRNICNGIPDTSETLHQAFGATSTTIYTTRTRSLFHWGFGKNRQGIAPGF